MVPEQLIFEHVVDGLLKGIGDRRTSVLEQRLLAAGWSGPGKKLPAYPYETWRSFLRIAREELFGALPEREGYEKLGELFVDGYFQTPLGGAVAGVVRLLGPKRTLLRATQQFRSANNFTETKVTEQNPKHIEVWMNTVDQKDFTVGIFRRGLQIAGAKEIQISQVPGPVDSCTFVVMWS